MTLSKDELKDIFLTDDILPLGEFEALPVTCMLGGLPDSYPYVCRVYEGIDYESLLVEALEHIKIRGNVYVKDRISHINPKLSETDLRDVLSKVGFYKGSYQSYSLRKTGTSELEDWILPNTRQFFNELPVNSFRQQYAVAFPNWNTQMHRDHKDFKTHGFRLMVPLSDDVYMGYEDPLGNPLVFRLMRGGAYFVNIAMMHRGFNGSQSGERINLIMQLDSDEIINDGTPIDPIDVYEISLLPDYALRYSEWEFSSEL